MVEGKREKEVLPLDVVINILKRVPVKSLVRFKCVSKEWLKLLETTPFFTKQQLDHSAGNTTLLLQRIHRQPPPLPFSICLIGPHYDLTHQSHLSHIASPAAKILASCNGLLCLRHNTFLSILNPATRQIRDVPTAPLLPFHYYVGFGFSPLADDYKIVRISMRVSAQDDQVVVLDNVRVDRAEVYSLTSGSWREIDAARLQPLCLVSSSVAITGTIFWLASMTCASDTDSEFVVSFDIGREIFTVVNGPPIPPSPSHPHCNNVLAVRNDKLAMFRHYIVGNFESCCIDLWVLEDFDGERWVKMHSVGPFWSIVYPLSLWGDEIVCREELSGQENDLRGVQTVLALFNLKTKKLKKLPSHRDDFCYVPFTYTESLVPV